MEKESFDKIMNNLTARIQLCKQYFCGISDTADLRQLTVDQLADLVSFSRTEYEKMTVILMVDLYHILGMGNLSAVQSTLFIRAIKEYSNYRPIIQLISTRVYDLFALPIISGKHSYTVQGLGKVKLTAYLGSPEAQNELNITTENPEDLSDQALTKQDLAPVSRKDLPFTYDALSQCVKFDSAKVDAVLKSLATLGITVGGKPETVVNKALHNSEYMGLKLSLDEDSQVTGRVLNPCMVNKLRKALSRFAE